jgi:hypothetical protein
MTRKPCEFRLIRYVPDPVKNEFVNIGVMLRAGDDSVLRFTRDWTRVRCLDPDADTQMLESLETEVGRRLLTDATDQSGMFLKRWEESLSNGLQITESKAYLAETIPAGLEDLMRLYVENAPRERTRRRGGRATVLAEMRTSFEHAGVWQLMRKHIAASAYTESGDPLRIDCGYRNGSMKMFQAISLESDAVDAKLLAYSAEGLRKGVQRMEKTPLVLTAITEPIRWPEGETEPGEETKARYDYARRIFAQHDVRLMTTSDLPRLAEVARTDLNV